CLNILRPLSHLCLCFSTLFGSLVFSISCPLTSPSATQTYTLSLHDALPISRRRGFIRGQLMRDRETREFLVDPLGAVGGGEPTHLLGSYGQANCLITVPAEETHVAPGQFVDVLFLTNRS